MTLDLTGVRRGKLVAQHDCGCASNGSKNRQWLCLCDCGRKRVVGASPFKQWRYLSCGHPECKDKTGPKVEEGRNQAILAAFQACGDFLQLRKQFDLSEKALRDIVAANDPDWKRYGRRQRKHQEIIEEFNRLGNKSEVAVKLGISWQTVHNVLKRKGKKTG